MLKDFRVVDAIAIILIAGTFVLQYKGISTMVPQSILLIIGYYFGKKSEILTTNNTTQNGD